MNTISFIKTSLKDVKKLFKHVDDITHQEIVSTVDTLDDLQERAKFLQSKIKDPFIQVGVIELLEEIKALFSTIEKIEEKRQIEDKNLLKQIHQIAFLVDSLELMFSQLEPQQIFDRLKEIDTSLTDILKKKPFNKDFIFPLIEVLQRKMMNLQFKFDFPIIEELDENKNSFAHRLMIQANKKPKQASKITNKIDELLDLVIVAKMFKYGKFQKAQKIFDRLDENTKLEIEKIIWKRQNYDFFKMDMTSALMDFVCEKILAC